MMCQAGVGEGGEETTLDGSEEEERRSEKKRRLGDTGELSTTARMERCFRSAVVCLCPYWV